MFINTPYFYYINVKYPHIAKNIMLLWGSECMNMYFSSLIYDCRQGKRYGFPSKDLSYIHELFKIHKEEFPHLLNIKKGDCNESEKS